MDDDYQFGDIDATASASGASAEGEAAPAPEAPSEGEAAPAPAAPAPEGGFGGGSRGHADELFSKRIDAKFRTFFVDLKESHNGKFVKVSEKSRGKKSTIMMDAEDVPAMIEALQEVEKQL